MRRRAVQSPPRRQKKPARATRATKPVATVAVVITFADITVAKTLEARLRGQHASLEKDVAEQSAKRAKAGKTQRSRKP